MAASQLALFDSGRSMPDGFKYQADFLSRDEERELLRHFENLTFREFEFQGFVGKRRVLSFGWKYDFNKHHLDKTDDIPAFLQPVRERAAQFAKLAPAELQQVLLTEYPVGAPIGWHRDRPVFDKVVGLSLLAPCVFRFRRKSGGSWERASVVAEPRSAYLLQGPARTEWEHSIPPVEQLRYSITFRNFR